MAQSLIAQVKKVEEVKDQKDIIEYLISKGFNPMSSKIIPNPKDITNKMLVRLDSILYEEVRKNVKDYANLSMYNPNEPNDTMLFRHGIEFIVAQGLQYEEKLVAYITKDDNFFDGKFQEVEKIFENSKSTKIFWWHIWDNPNPDEDDYYCLRRNDE
jgi:flavorubredoxin